MIEIVEAGALTTVQDGGRRGWAHLGVARSGAFDLAALHAANNLVGNAPDEPALEVTGGAVAIRFLDAVTVAAAGAVCPGIDHLVATSRPAGTVLRLGRPVTGLRTYLAFRGGLDVPAVLGSAATDTLSGLGPAPLRPGDRVAVGRSNTPVPGVAGAPARHTPHAPLAVTPGPRADWFADTGPLFATVWTVRSQSNRVGIRLDGPALTRLVTGELPSEGLLPGALQVPPDGRPIIIGPDGPVTGGYPVIGVLSRDDLSRAAQLRPGDEVRFSSRTGARRPT